MGRQALGRLGKSSDIKKTNTQSKKKHLGTDLLWVLTLVNRQN